MMQIQTADTTTSPLCRLARLLVIAVLLQAAAFAQTVQNSETVQAVQNSPTGLTLHEAIVRAELSPAAHVAEEQVNVVRGQVRQAGLGPNPRIYLSTEDVRPWADQFSFANNTEDYGYLAQTVEVDRKRAKRVEVARANLRRSEAEQTFQLQVIAGRVAGSYWAAAASLRVADLLQQDLAAVDDMVRYHKERVDAGAMRGVDLLRIEIERDRVFVALEVAHRDVALTRLDLFRQIGIPPSPSIVLTDQIDASDPLPPVALEIALTQRQDILAARAAVAAADADVTLQHALAFPDPDLLGGYKRNSGADTLFASIQLPLSFRNRNQGEIERARAQARIARAQLEQAQLLARSDIEAASQTYDTQRRIVHDLLPDMRGRAKRNLDIMNDAYRTGGLDLLRYIDAERTEIEVELSAVRTLSDYHQSVLRLQLAYGVQP